MELIVISSNLVKLFMVSVLAYWTYIKITDYKYNKAYRVVFIILCSINISISYIILINFFSPINTILILYLIYGLIMNFTIKNEESDYNVLAYIFSCIISYAIYLISTVISGVILGLFSKQNGYANPTSMIIIPSISILLLLFIFSRKRFKNGFNFLKNKKTNNKINIFTIFSTGLILLIFGITQKIETKYSMVGLYLIVGSILIMFSLIIWIKNQITKTYKNRMRDRTIEIQKTEIDEQTKIIEEVKAENLKLATAIHKYNKKLSSLEFAMKNALELETNTEFANELSVILEETKETAENFAKETEVNTNKLPLTNIPGIDNMFKYMQEEARKNGINFDVKLNESIHYLIENTISKDKFETLIGDHLKDAIIAVDASEASYKSILVTLGLVKGIYEFSVYDTGIEFEIETLLKLGEEQVTTHKETGGSGIGFMTTFETLKECKASLVIEEYKPETTNYTKSVTIRFDGRNEYKICSYRAEKIKEQKYKRRIIIEKLK